MNILYGVISYLLPSLIPVQCVLRCFSGNSQYAAQCLSQSYCVTITSKSGTVQRSCDGNSLSQISVCAMYSELAETRTVHPGYSSSPIYYDHSSSQIKTIPKIELSTRSSRRTPAQMCFNAGDLGDVCCCNTDFCNTAPKRRIFVLLIVSLFIIYF